MIYRESRAVWRKLWRKEPGMRRIVLSFNARALIPMLTAVADDSGFLAPVAEGNKPWRQLAQLLHVEVKDRRDFARRIRELVEYGHDGEPLCLIIESGHYRLTDFERSQANRKGAPDRSPSDR